MVEVDVRSLFGRHRWLRDAITAAAFAGVVLSARSSLADHYVVPSGSMEPTVMTGSRIVVDKTAYGWRLPFLDRWMVGPASPAHGDVVVVRSPETGETLLKRVVATEGDRVEVRDGRVWLEGRLAEPRERSVGTDVHYGGPDFGPTVVPAHRLLVLGDNRGNSHDGRSFGWVPVADVLGRAVAVYWAPEGGGGGASDGGPCWRVLDASR
jgi:signal peptidase I